MPRVELIYDEGCPNIRDARTALLEAFAATGITATWTEWERKDPQSPPHVRAYGSPTILVDGQDIDGVPPGSGTDCCRVYSMDVGALRGAPPPARIAAALRRGRTVPATRLAAGRSGWWRFFGALPGVAGATLPIGACPACWPAYAGVLGSLGLGALFESSYRVPITIGLVAATLAALAFRARARRGYRPLLLGAGSSALVLAFRLAQPVDSLVYAGVAGLVAASAWNAWPTRRSIGAACPACARPGPDADADMAGASHGGPATSRTRTSTTATETECM